MSKIKIIILSLILFFGLHHQKIYAQEKSVFIDTISPYQNIVVGQTIPINVGVTSVTPNTTYKYFFYGGIAPDDYISVQTIMSDGASHTISVGNQRYSLAFNSAYSSGSALTALPIESELNCKKTTSDIGETKPTYWGISIPSGTVAGTYTGTNTIIAVKGETAQW